MSSLVQEVVQVEVPEIAPEMVYNKLVENDPSLKLMIKQIENTNSPNTHIEQTIRDTKLKHEQDADMLSQLINTALSKYDAENTKALVYITKKYGNPDQLVMITSGLVSAGSPAGACNTKAMRRICANPTGELGMGNTKAYNAKIENTDDYVLVRFPEQIRADSIPISRATLSVHISQKHNAYEFLGMWAMKQGVAPSRGCVSFILPSSYN